MSDSTAQKPRLDGTVTVGNLLQVAVMLCGFGAFLLGGSGRIDQTAREVADLKASMAQQAAGTRDSIREAMSRVEANLAGISGQVQSLPQIAERVRRLEVDIGRLQEADADLSTRIENRRNVVDARIDAMGRTLTEAAIRLEALTRAERAERGPGPR